MTGTSICQSENADPQALNQWQFAACLSAGHEAIEYFNSLPLKANGIQPSEPLQEGNNEAEWIVDLTTRADREGRYGAPALFCCLLETEEKPFWLSACSRLCSTRKSLR